MDGEYMEYDKSPACRSATSFRRGSGDVICCKGIRFRLVSMRGDVICCKGIRFRLVSMRGALMRRPSHDVCGEWWEPNRIKE